MPRANCRCGQTLQFDAADERIDCPACGARVRVRRKGDDPTQVAARAQGERDPDTRPEPDGFIRFHCPCGRRLKVPQVDRPSHGKCPDCGTVVPVPDPATPRVARPAANDPERRTDELAVADIRALDAWIQKFEAVEAHTPASAMPVVPVAAGSGAVEAGLRLCPGCKRPVHLGADVCRHCGSSVPRR